jgi:hypothetical protein
LARIKSQEGSVAPEERINPATRAPIIIARDSDAVDTNCLPVNARTKVKQIES